MGNCLREKEGKHGRLRGDKTRVIVRKKRKIGGEKSIYETKEYLELKSRTQ